MKTRRWLVKTKRDANFIGFNLSLHINMLTIQTPFDAIFLSLMQKTLMIYCANAKTTRKTMIKFKTKLTINCNFSTVVKVSMLKEIQRICNEIKHVWYHEGFCTMINRNKRGTLTPPQRGLIPL